MLQPMAVSAGSGLYPSLHGVPGAVPGSGLMTIYPPTTSSTSMPHGHSSFMIDDILGKSNSASTIPHHRGQLSPGGSDPSTAGSLHPAKPTPINPTLLHTASLTANTPVSLSPSVFKPTAIYDPLLSPYLPGVSTYPTGLQGTNIYPFPYHQRLDYTQAILERHAYGKGNIIYFIRSLKKA